MALGGLPWGLHGQGGGDCLAVGTSHILPWDLLLMQRSHPLCPGLPGPATKHLCPHPPAGCSSGTAAGGRGDVATQNSCWEHPPPREILWTQLKGINPNPVLCLVRTMCSPLFPGMGREAPQALGQQTLLHSGIHLGQQTLE